MTRDRKTLEPNALNPTKLRRKDFSLRQSFVAYAIAAATLASLLSWGTLLVLAAYEQYVYDESYGGSNSYLYDVENGTLVSAVVQNLDKTNDLLVPVFLPDQSSSGRRVPLSSIRAEDRTTFSIYLTNVAANSSESLSFPTMDFESSDEEVMGDFWNRGWNAFVEQLSKNPAGIEARCYEEALGGLPTNAEEARAMFTASFGSDLAAPFDVWSTSMYTEQDLINRKTAERAAYILIVIWFALCFLICGNRFYKSRLAKPMNLLTKAADEIGQQNLDCAISYDRKDEMGKLVASFETMRRSLEESQRKLWQTAEDRKRLNAAFAHDLRTPLAVLKGRIEMLDIRAAEDEEDTIRVACKTLLTQVARLEGFVEVMSRLQKLEDRPVNKRPVKADTLVKSLEETAEALSAETELSIDITVDPHSISLARPNASRDLDLFIDSPLVLEAIENLLSNALRFASNRVQLAISTTGDASLLKIAVSDDGPGFSIEAIERGCEPFYSTEKKNREENHFGIGLSTAKALCEKHGGCLKLLNLDDGASAIATFSVRRP